MICPKCNAESMDGSTFCIKCGANLKEIASQVPNQGTVNTEPTNVEQPKIVAQPVATPQPVQSQPANVVPQQTPQTPQTPTATKPAGGSLNFLMYIIAILLKPIKCFKEEESKLEEIKNPLIFSVIIAGAVTIINLIKTMFTTVRVTSIWSNETKWVWENLKEIKYISVIGKNFLIYTGIIFAIAIVFYIASLIAKKELKFSKSLAISVTSIIPAVLGLLILSPITMLIWQPLGIIIGIFSAIYSIVILYELVNNELNLEGDSKVYFNFICFGILAVAGYFTYINLFTQSITNDLGNLMDMFK